MAAMQAVFGTCELFQMILLQLPSHQISRLRLVCKEWKANIITSSTIRRHYGNGSLAPSHWEGTNRIPIYDESPNIKLHPIIRHLAKVESVVPDLWMKTFELHRSDAQSQTMIDAREEFVTTPPCQYFHIYHRHTGKEHDIRFNKDGIKIGDLLNLGKGLDDDIAMKLSQGACGCCRCPWEFTVIVKEDTAKSGWWKQLRTNEDSVS